MNTRSDTLPERPFGDQATEHASISATRTVYWLLRRELWENRSLYVAPLIVAGLALFGFLISLLWLPASVRRIATLDPARQHALLARPYDLVAILIIFVTVIVGWFYCLEALHSERRDRSILFWKSLPVSDLTTVLTKASIPLVVLPLFAFAIVIATHLIMLVVSTLVLWSSGASVTMLWTQVPVFQDSPVLFYGLATLALWYAPIYAWLLLVSAWAQRAVFLWAVLPPLLLAFVERIALHTWHVGSLLKFRLFDGFSQAFVLKGGAAAAGSDGGVGAGGSAEHMAQVFDPIPDPAKFLSSPDVWIGLGVAAALLAVTVWLRRRREPI
jgi:ABC-2 type transport system permease protein